MEFLVVAIGILLVLIVTAAVMDIRARRTRRRISVDPDGVLDARRINQPRGDLYGSGGNSGGGF